MFREGIFVLFLMCIIAALTALAFFIVLATVVLNPDLSLWYRIPAFIIDILLAYFTGYMVCTVKHDL